MVAIPDLMIAPDEDIAGRYAAEVDWLKTRFAAGAAIATACSGALLLAETGGVVAGLRRPYGLRDRQPRLLIAAADRAAYEAVRLRGV